MLDTKLVGMNYPNQILFKCQPSYRASSKTLHPAIETVFQTLIAHQFNSIVKLQGIFRTGRDANSNSFLTNNHK